MTGDLSPPSHFFSISTFEPTHLYVICMKNAACGACPRVKKGCLDTFVCLSNNVQSDRNHLGAYCRSGSLVMLWLRYDNTSGSRLLSLWQKKLCDAPSPQKWGIAARTCYKVTAKSCHKIRLTPLQTTSFPSLPTVYDMFYPSLL